MRDRFVDGGRSYKDVVSNQWTQYMGQRSKEGHEKTNEADDENRKYEQT